MFAGELCTIHYCLIDDNKRELLILKDCVFIDE